MFGLIKWAAIAGFFAWVAINYGPMLGLSDGQVHQVSSAVNAVADVAVTPEQKAQAEAAIKQITPTPEQLRNQIQAAVPVIDSKIEEGKSAIQNIATNVREGMVKQP